MGKIGFGNAAENMIVAALSVTFFGIPRVHYYCIVNGGIFQTVANAVYVFAALCGAAVLFRILSAGNNIRISEYEGVFITMVACQAISCFNAVDRTTAVFGAPGRNEGFLMLLCYYLFFYAARMIESENKRGLVLKIFIGTMTVHALYGLGQFYDLTDLYFIHDYYHYAVSGVAGNPNFMASLMVISCGATVGIMLFAKTVIGRAMAFVLFAVFAATLIFTKTMSGYVGLAVIIFVVFLLFFRLIQIKKGTKTALAAGMAAVGAGLVILWGVDRLAYGIISVELKGVYYQIAYGFDINTAASGRFLIWKNIFQMLPQYIFSGVGIDCLQAPYYHNFGLLFGSYVDKAHNELIHVLITMGLPVFLCYIAIYVLAVKDMLGKIKTGTNRPVYAALLFAFIGYISQGMFNISVIDVAPYFWILLGLCAKQLIKTDCD